VCSVRSHEVEAFAEVSDALTQEEDVSVSGRERAARSREDETDHDYGQHEGRYHAFEASTESAQPRSDASWVRVLIGDLASSW
jgi:hypothetical protein